MAIELKCITINCFMTNFTILNKIYKIINQLVN